VCVIYDEVLGVFSSAEVEEKGEERFFQEWEYGSLLKMCVSLGKKNGGSHGDFSYFYKCGVEYRQTDDEKTNPSELDHTEACSNPWLCTRDPTKMRLARAKTREHLVPTIDLH
jgi:hypothetical protein